MSRLGSPRRPRKDPGSRPPAMPGSSQPTSSPATPLADFSLRDAAEAEDRRRLRTALTVAAVFHLLLFLIQFPALSPSGEVEAAERVRLYPVEPLPRLRVEEPPPVHVEQRPELPTIPVPEALAPEVVRVPELPPVELPVELASWTSDVEIPAPPVRVPRTPRTTEPLEVRGEVVPPVTVFAPRPRYTEAARRVRFEGTVILKAVIDREGRVTALEVLEPLPLGLTEAAVEAARRWRFQPATLRDQPVPVYWRLTVTFRLQ